MLVSKFVEENSYNHFSTEKLQGYIYQDIFDISYFNKFKKYIETIFLKTSTNTFKTHGCAFNFENKNIKLVSSKASAREQHVMFDIAFEKDLYYQTPDTILEWYNNKLKTELSPFFLFYLNTLKKLPPYNLNPDDWITTRIHLNVCNYEQFLSLHKDGNPFICDLPTARLHSFTFYLFDHIENCGGEFWSVNGFVYKPKQNCAILLENGARVPHGVTANMHPEKKVRLAFTCRILHKDDLFLFGDPSKHLYRLNHFDDI